jgi:predicted nucleic acid-binding protein
MQQKIIVDTWPLVALLNQRDRWHSWSVEQWAKIAPPLLTCEPVITESCFLLQHIHGGRHAVLQLLSRGVVQIDFALNQDCETVQKLLNQYQSVPMSLADACLVRMSEQYPNHQVLSLDSDFNIYRKNKSQVIPVLMPKFSP